MFKLLLYDCKGQELKLGDIVRVISGDRYGNEFYARVTYLKDQQAIAPFHTFSFHAFEKVDELPKEVIKSTETRYDIWYTEADERKAEQFESYLIDWRACEYLLQKRCFRIVPDTQLALF